MKKLLFFIISFLCCLNVFTQTDASPVTSGGKKESKLQFNWALLWSGSLDMSASNPMNFSLNNRGEIRLHFIPQNKNYNKFFQETLAVSGFTLRGQILDRHVLSFGFKPFQAANDPDKALTHFTGGLYHGQTGSRLLYGVLDEWGLSARIRNPWIRSPPYPENHKPLMADLKTTVSGTKEDELYLYTSSPFFELNQNYKLRGFIAAQTLVTQFTPALSGGIDFTFFKKNNMLFEVFYTGKTLPPFKPSSWFSNPPALPERKFHLTAAALAFSNPLISVSSDFAFSDTFAWGKDIYFNFGITVTPLLPFGSRARPLAISLAVDGSGDRFVNRDGAILKEGFRGAAKIEWKGKYSSLYKFSLILRGNDLGENINRSSTDFYFRFPVQTGKNKKYIPIRFTRFSLSADRNAENPLKINDSFSGNIALNINFKKIKPIGISFSGSLKGIGSVISENPEKVPIFFPIPINNVNETWKWNNASVHCEIYWAPLNFQFRLRGGISFFNEKEEKWDFSLSAAFRFKYGRFNIKVSSSDFPQNWSIGLSWRVEKKEKYEKK